MFLSEIIDKIGVDNAEYLFPKISVLGKRGVTVEGHRGLQYFSSEEIKFKIRGGSVTILGESLKLSEVSISEAVITGTVKSVTYA